MTKVNKSLQQQLMNSKHKREKIFTRPLKNIKGDISQNLRVDGQSGDTVKVKCKTRENSNFLKNCKMVISVKIRNFSRSHMTKRTSPLESSREI